MAVFKCKMCGGTIEFSEGASVGICDSCGTKQTLPRLDDDRRANMYDRANHFRRNNEFDKAAGIYEQILNEDGEDAEAYWSLVLCRYGIEYVEDPSTHKRVPTVNRAQYTSVFDDDNYKSAIRYADPEQKAVYEAEATAINAIQKGILAISQKEEPFDVFICYKETDANGRRTQDLVLANDLYHQLTQEGFKVFFSRITLEDKLGTAYEPYIFAALNSSKVMVVIGTRPEYFNAVWVKNEWSRYLALVKQSGGKKLLIPAYRDMDPYDLPEEFSHLQAQDMGKLGFMQDLIRGIGKFISADGDKAENKETFSESDSRIAPLLKRTFMFLEDEKWNEANKYAEKVLDMDPECAEAYLAKLMAEFWVRNQDDWKNLSRNVVWRIDEGMAYDPNDSQNYKKAIHFADENLKKFLEETRCDIIYTAAKSILDNDQSTLFLLATELFETILNYKNSEELAKLCRERAENVDKTLKMLIDKKPQIFRKFGVYVAAGLDHVVGLKEDGTVFASGQNYYGECDVEDWSDIVAVAACNYLTVGLKSNGTLVATGCYGYDDELVVNRTLEDWSDIVAIAAGDRHTVGLKADGTLVASGQNYYGECDVEAWSDIVAIAAGGEHTVGLKADGTLVASGQNYYGECDVEAWSDIVAIAAGDHHTVGLKADGTVVVTGSYECGIFDVEAWSDIVAIAAGGEHVVGLKADGTVVATGKNEDEECNFHDGIFRDILAVAAGGRHIVCLRDDGRVLNCGHHHDLDLSFFYNINKLLENIEETNLKIEEIARIAKENARIAKENARIAEENARIKAQYRNSNLCQHCGGAFKGLFIKTCIKCGKKKDY